MPEKSEITLDENTDHLTSEEYEAIQKLISDTLATNMQNLDGVSIPTGISLQDFMRTFLSQEDQETIRSFFSENITNDRIDCVLQKNWTKFTPAPTY